LKPSPEAIAREVCLAWPSRGSLPAYSSVFQYIFIIS
jgi:hypothetical protein